jgi:hypothetical protein
MIGVAALIQTRLTRSLLFAVVVNVAEPAVSQLK